MAIKLENVGIAVRDLEATIAFFTDLGLTIVATAATRPEARPARIAADLAAQILRLDPPDAPKRDHVRPGGLSRAMTDGV